MGEQEDKRYKGGRGMGKMLYTDAKETEQGGHVCPNCGSKSFKLAANVGGNKTFVNVYNCSQCGEAIVLKYQRDEDVRYSD